MPKNNENLVYYYSYVCVSGYVHYKYKDKPTIIINISDELWNRIGYLFPKKAKDSV